VNGFVGCARRALAQTLSFMALLLAWMAMTVENVTTTPSGVIMALAALVGAVIFGAIAVGRLEAIARVREHGLSANATITKVDEEFISVPSGYIGWSTRVTVSFTDTSGRLVRALYADHARAGGKKEGQTIQIVYNPAKPTSISPAGQVDPRWVEVFFIGLGAVVLLGMSVYFAYRAWLA
jgi:hypothetical protein